jgi:riboflavin kinase/FMN adenylyltransferase
VLTIGNFDGVHLGHRALVHRLVERAKQVKAPAIVMTFEPHPVKVLYPDRKLHRIFDVDDQSHQLEALGVDALVIEPFSREFSQLPPDRYLLEWIFRPFTPETLIVGYDFSFGANRQGSIDFLKERAPTLGFNMEVIPPVKVGDVLVSSTRIRQAVEAGDVSLARNLLGRSFYVKGLVEKGAGRGRTIGVPTANLRTTAETVPARGVYAAWASARGKSWKAAVNIGFNPTFQKSNPDPLSPPLPSIEAHLIGFTGDLYGETIQLDFVSRVRDEKKFSGVDALVAQIKNDILECNQILDQSGRTV